uniref:FBD domain-containing protein n=1 Tax=Aegilops tauschii subsp. strangulata TaxID=200361 RepID=A0A453C430_AEGTS
KLQDLRFGKSDICNVLLTCKQLKHLRMFNCNSGVWTTLQVEHLELDPLSVGDVPLLETVDLTNVCLSSHKMVKLSEFLGGTSVRNLRLGFESEKIWVQPEHLTRQLAAVFCQLTFVHMAEIPEGYDLSWSLFILEPAPNLKELYLTVWDHLCTMETDREKRRALSYSIRKGLRWESSASRFQHRSLETLVIFGFESKEYMLTHVRCVMEAAVNLKNVFLYNRLACEMCRDNPPPSSFPFAETKKLLVEKIITSGIDSAASIHFLSG